VGRRTDGRREDPMISCHGRLKAAFLFQQRAEPMKITLQTGPGVNLVRGFRPGEVRIGDQTITSSCLVTAESLTTDWPPQTPNALTLAHFDWVVAQEPEIVLLGTGTRQRFPDHAIVAALLGKRIGLEVMDTGAACRTFNILVAEDRRVVAALILRDDA